MARKYKSDNSVSVFKLNPQGTLAKFSLIHERKLSKFYDRMCPFTPILITITIQKLGITAKQNAKKIEM